MSDRIKDLLRKIAKLAERGVDGEKESARQKMVEISQKHGIDLSLLNDDEKPHRWKIKKGNFAEKILVQILGGYWEGRDIFYIKKANRKVAIRMNCSDAEAIEIQAKYDHYYAAWNRKLPDFFTAFLYANQPDLIREGNSESEPTEEEMERQRRAYRMSMEIDGDHFMRQLKQ